MARRDEEIKKNIIDQLYWDSQVDASNLQVLVNEGRVTLMGVVNTYAARKAALNDAWIIPGVRALQDQLLVRYTVEVPPDDRIKRSIEEALIAHSEIDSSGIQVTVNAGLITLEGSVDAYWRRLAVEEAAGSVTGVLAIKNNIAVVPTESAEDEEIARELTSTLDRSERVPAGAVTVQVDSGVVTLTGSVSDMLASMTAAELAGRTRGVVDVENQILVTGE
jgi:osmotically-inducible protein OsmY